jgi:hypothetical protein
VSRIRTTWFAVPLALALGACACPFSWMASSSPAEPAQVSADVGGADAGACCGRCEGKDPSQCAECPRKGACQACPAKSR